MGILAVEAFALHSTYHTNKGKSTCLLVFGQYTILTINHVADWIYIHQRKQAQIDKDTTHENTTRIDNDYRVGGKLMTRTKSDYKYKTPVKRSARNCSHMDEWNCHPKNGSGNNDNKYPQHQYL